MAGSCIIYINHDLIVRKYGSGKSKQSFSDKDIDNNTMDVFTVPRSYNFRASAW